MRLDTPHGLASSPPGTLTAPMPEFDEEVEMTAEQLSAAAGVILSLVFSYVPPVRGGSNRWTAMAGRSAADRAVAV
jgi:hypothetical protein